MINWCSFHQVDDISLLRRIESKLDISLPEEYIQLVMRYDGGVPDKKVFIAGEKSRIFQRLISIQISKHPNIEDALEWVDMNRIVIPFALDPFGNIVCFAYDAKKVSTVVFVETETNSVFEINKSFVDFMDSLERI